MPQSTESQAPIVPIIGGGPAGMSCALWLHNYGLKPVIIEQADALGGMARLSPYPNAWLLGERGKTARENAAEFAAHIRELAVETWLRARPHRLRREHDGRFRLDVSGTPAARSLSSPAIVIATGTRFAGEDWLDRVENARRVGAAGRLHLGAAAVGEPGVDLGSHVAVIGGGDNAFDVSRMLAEKGVRVTLVMLPPQAMRPGAEPGLDRQFAHVVGELGGVLAPALAALPEQPRVGIGAQARHTAERALLLDDHGVEAVIVQPQRARHARGSAPDDRHDRRS